MRKLLAILLLLPCQAAWADYFESGFHVSGYFEGGYFEVDSALIAVPDVVGEANFAAADMILEAASLDGGTETVACSAETADEILAQNPVAGTEVAASTSVDLTSSSGTACTGRPAVRLGIEQLTGVEL